jgi:hypothetical protein
MEAGPRLHEQQLKGLHECCAQLGSPLLQQIRLFLQICGFTKLCCVPHALWLRQATKHVFDRWFLTVDILKELMLLNVHKMAVSH